MSMNDEIRIRATRRVDRRKHEYYVAVTSIPGSVRLDKTLFILFPDDENGGDLVIKKYEQGAGRTDGEDEDEEGGGEDEGE